MKILSIQAEAREISVQNRISGESRINNFSDSELSCVKENLTNPITKIE